MMAAGCILVVGVFVLFASVVVWGLGGRPTLRCDECGTPSRDIMPLFAARGDWRVIRDTFPGMNGHLRLCASCRAGWVRAALQNREGL